MVWPTVVRDTTLLPDLDREYKLEDEELEADLMVPLAEGLRWVEVERTWEVGPERDDGRDVEVGEEGR